MLRNIISRTAYVFFFALMLLAYIFYRNYFLLLMMIFMIVFPVVSVVLLRRAKKSISISLDVPGRVEKKAPFEITLTLKNTSYIPIIQSHIEMTLENPFYPGLPSHHFVCGIAARKGGTVKFTVTPEYSGVMSLKIKEFRIWDMTGMADAIIPADISKDVHVLPSPSEEEIELTMAGGAGMVELSEQDTKGNDSSMVIDTRDYHPGDKLQRIHWKLSTKLDKLIVKEYGSMSSDDVLVVIELSHGDFTRVRGSDSYINNRKSFDAVFDVYYTLALALLKEKRPFMVSWYSPGAGELKSIPVSGKEELLESLIMMSYEKPPATAGNAWQLAKAVLDEYGEFIYISPLLPQSIYGHSGGELIFEKRSEDGKPLAAAVFSGT